MKTTIIWAAALLLWACDSTKPVYDPPENPAYKDQDPLEREIFEAEMTALEDAKGIRCCRAHAAFSDIEWTDYNGIAIERGWLHYDAKAASACLADSRVKIPASSCREWSKPDSCNDVYIGLQGTNDPCNIKLNNGRSGTAGVWCREDLICNFTNGRCERSDLESYEVESDYDPPSRCNGCPDGMTCNGINNHWFCIPIVPEGGECSPSSPFMSRKCDHGLVCRYGRCERPSLNSCGSRAYNFFETLAESRCELARRCCDLQNIQGCIVDHLESYREVISAVDRGWIVLHPIEESICADGYRYARHHPKEGECTTATLPCPDVLTPNRGQGEPCGDTEPVPEACVEGLYCDPETLSCRPIPGQCGEEPCPTGLVCDEGACALPPPQITTGDCER